MSNEALWPTHIELHDLSDECDLEQAVTECLLVSNKLNDKNNLPLKYWGTPELYRIHEELIMPRFYAHLERCYQFKPESVSVANWIFGGNDGSGLEPHIHAGSHFTAVFYPMVDGGSIVMVDPRYSAQRGYPRDFIDGHFSKRKINPVAGQLVIMPSFLEHYVTGFDKGIRLSFVNDIILRTEDGDVHFD